MNKTKFIILIKWVYFVISMLSLSSVITVTQAVDDLSKYIFIVETDGYSKFILEKFDTNYVNIDIIDTNIDLFAQNSVEKLEQITIQIEKEIEDEQKRKSQRIFIPISYSNDEIVRKICDVFVSNCDEALTIVRYESGFNPNAISHTGDYGLFQINCYWHRNKFSGDCYALLDIDSNIRVAKQIYDAQGWRPWVTSKYLYR